MDSEQGMSHFERDIRRAIGQGLPIGPLANVYIKARRSGDAIDWDDIDDLVREQYGPENLAYCHKAAKVGA